MWREIFDIHGLKCEGEWARRHEDDLRQQVYHCRNINDDWVFRRIYHYPTAIGNTGWGIETHEIRAQGSGGAAHFEPVLRELRDVEKIMAPRMNVDQDANRLREQSLKEAFGDILEIRPRGYFVPWFAPIDLLAQWRGIENLLMDLVDNAEWVHECLGRITAGHLGMLEQLEAQGGLSGNHDAHFVGSGGQGYVDELPKAGFDPQRVRPIDMWGQATAQIFAEVSPDMHASFSLPYDRQWLERFGLACYGCCEPLHDKVGILRSIPNLRRISMSPWVDVAKGAAAIGADYIFSSKPNPAILASERWDPEHARASIRHVLEKTRGCVVEFIMKDTQTCRNEPHRVSEWTSAAMEEVLRWSERNG